MRETIIARGEVYLYPMLMIMTCMQACSKRWCCIAVCVCLWWFAVLTPAIADDTLSSNTGHSFVEQLQVLQTGNFSTKATAVEALEGIDDDRVLSVLKALLNGDLRYRKDDDRVVFIKDVEEGYQLTDVLSGVDLGVTGRRNVKKITVNNQLRGQLRSAIARLSLSHKNPKVRLTSVQELIKDMDADTTALFRGAMGKESDENVLDVIRTGLALVDINAEDRSTRLRAITELGETLNPIAKVRLEQLLAQDNDGAHLEADAELRRAAQKSLNRFKERQELYELLNTLFFGLSLGSVLLLAAIGLAITFGVMGVINMAHGELIMLGAYTTYVVQLMMPNHIDYSLFVAIPAAFLVAGLVGVAIERGVIRFLYGRTLETLLATFGISLILQQAVRSIFSPLNRSVETPAWMSGAWEFNASLSLTYNRLYIILFSLLVFAALLMILKKTSLGLQVRAVTQNRPMAKAMGVRTEWVDALTFGLGSGIAGVAGVALSQLTNVGPNLGQAYIIDSFMVVVFGGVGNLWGTLVGAMSLGVVNKFLEPWAGAVLAKILVLIVIILFIQKRPRGLFAQKGRSVEG